MAKSLAQRKLEQAQRRAKPPRPTGSIGRIAAGSVGRAAELPLITQPTQRVATRSSPRRNIAQMETDGIELGRCAWADKGMCHLEGAASAFPVALLKCSS